MAKPRDSTVPCSVAVWSALCGLLGAGAGGWIGFGWCVRAAQGQGGLWVVDALAGLVALAAGAAIGGLVATVLGALLRWVIGLLVRVMQGA